MVSPAGADAGPQAWYQAALSQQGFVADAAQAAAIVQLEHLYQQLLLFKAKRHRLLGTWLPQPDLPRGLFLWGGVGRGKTRLMDAFYTCLPYKRKNRVHFHAFMRDIHAQLRSLKGEEDPLKSVISALAKRYRVLCFDEFHVSDIADAMILGRLLEGLLHHGVVMVLTSNYPPDGLYPNGLQRDHFLPTIALLNREFDVVPLAAGCDYRLLKLEKEACYLTPITPDTHAQLQALFAGIAKGAAQPTAFTVCNRPITALARAENAVWFDFDTLCGMPRSQLDYLEIAQRYSTVFVSDIPRLNANSASAARRLTWMVDVFYDARVKLVLSAAVPASELYPEGAFATEFLRTVSRLAEMQTVHYLHTPHQLAPVSDRLSL